MLVDGGNDARYLPTGHLVYALADGLFAVAFDLDSMTVSGGPVPLAQGIMRAGAGQTGVAHYGVSEGGTLAYVIGADATEARILVWVDRSGREEALGVPPRQYVKPSISPDRTKVALDVRDQELDIWTWDLAREALTRLTFDPGEDEFPVWSPDGRQIAFANANTSLFLRAADGTGSAERLADHSNQILPTSFLPDGTGILFFGSGDEGDDDIAIFRLEGENRITPVLETTFNESYPQVSPDGRWLAYVSDESGREEVYVRPFPDIDAGRWQVSTGGGVQPLWARSGLELFYRNGEAVFAVPIRTDPSFVADTPEELFEGDYVSDLGGPNYDVSFDGQRFLMIRRLEGASQTAQIIIVENWFEELKRLVPTE